MCAKAFQCDACDALEAGEPLGNFTFAVTDPDSPSRAKVSGEWCVDCLASFQDWREGRFPVYLEDDADEVGSRGADA